MRFRFLFFLFLSVGLSANCQIDNIKRLAASGKLVVASSLAKNDKTYRGIFILNVKTIEDAHVLLETDPRIREKVLEAEVLKWFGSAALPTYLFA
jgi:uncharacterized protein YciI